MSPRDTAFVPSYRPRFTFKGRLKWLCPNCGRINAQQIDYTTWRVRCRCRHTYAIGHTLYHLAAYRRAGRAVLPPEDIAFPVARLKPYRERMAIHDVATAEEPH